MFDSRNLGSGLPVDSLAGLLDISSAPVSFGYHDAAAHSAETTAWNSRSRTGRIGWWNRHRQLRASISVAIVLTLGFLPATQNAILSVVSHAG